MAVDLDVPEEFRRIFAALVKAIQPRYLDPDTVRTYWIVLHTLPMEALQRSADELATKRFWPNTGDWFDAAARLGRGWLAPTHQIPEAGSRHLDELDDLRVNDPARDDVCKGLSMDDQTALMARYGLSWPPR